MNNPRQQITRQLDRLFGDTSIPASTTKAHLEYLSEHIDTLIETLDADGVEADED
jgi:hypothetical protein